jgi:hypothetical protein
MRSVQREPVAVVFGADGWECRFDFFGRYGRQQCQLCDGEVRVEVGGDAVVAAGIERVGAAEECDGRVRAEGARDQGGVFGCDIMEIEADGGDDEKLRCGGLLLELALALKCFA